MEKTITIGEKEVRFKTSAAVPYLYRDKFHSDVFVDIQKLVEYKKKSKGGNLPVEVLEIFEKLAYIMAKHADKSQPDDLVEWLEQFDTFDIYVILPEILTLWNINTITSSVPKK